MMRVSDVSLQRLSVTTLSLTFLACSHAPPADFAPDPGLVAQIRDIRIVTAQDRACPGGWIQASYEAVRSEEHTSELQSHHDLVCRLLLEKKKKQKKILQQHRSAY